MTNGNERLDRIEQIQESNARAIAALNETMTASLNALAENMNRGFEILTANLNNLTNNVNSLTEDVNRTLARNAIFR